jgi:hypothetical protein
MTSSNASSSFQKRPSGRPWLPPNLIPLIQNFFILTWTAIWLYLSLAMVVASFSAIQLQTKVIDQAQRGSVPPVALIVLHYQRYEKDVSLLGKLDSQNNVAGDASLSSVTSSLYTKLFKPDDPFPVDAVKAIKEKCEKPDLASQIRTECTLFAKKVQSASSIDSGDASTPDSKATGEDSLTVRSRIEKYESLPEFGVGTDFNVHQTLTSFLLPWLPRDMLLSTLPHPTLVLLVTISMGALGSVLFMLQLHFISLGNTSIHRTSLSWHIFRPFQGMTTALAIYLLVKAGQISVSHSSGIDEADLNPFVLGFLGVVSGLLSDQAIDRLSAAGVELFKPRGDVSSATRARRGADAVPTPPATTDADTAADTVSGGQGASPTHEVLVSRE